MSFKTSGLRAMAVRHAFDRTEVLRGIDCYIEPDELVALAGPNGSGKTTLLRALSGSIEPSAGHVSLDGVPLSRVGARTRARRLAFVGQHTDPNLIFTVEQLVWMGRTPYRTAWRTYGRTDRLAVESALKAAQLEGSTTKVFAELSGGEQQRVMLAIALAQHADFLLLDEPTVHLDLHHQHALLELLSALRRELGVAVLAVMHDINLAALYFDRILLLQNGALVAQGRPADVIGRSRFRQTFAAPLAVVSHPQTGVPQVLLERKE